MVGMTSPQEIKQEFLGFEHNLSIISTFPVLDARQTTRQSHQACPD